MLKKFLIGGTFGVLALSAATAVVIGLTFIGSLLVPIIGPDGIVVLFVGIVAFLLFGLAGVMAGD